MQSAPTGTPWLEYFPEQGRPVQKSMLTSFPFSIGRNDNTHLPINSTRVSREHAVIVRAGNSYRVRDLDSTNGTFVNGQRIEEATLTDGDIVVIADVEFTFFTGASQAPRKTVTQVIGFQKADPASLKGQDVVRSLRRLQETVLQGSQCISRRPVVELSSGKSIGFEVVVRQTHMERDCPETDRLVVSAHPRLALRLRELYCLLAADALAQTKGLKLFLPLEAGDLDPGVSEHCIDLLERAQCALSAVVLEFPDTAVNDIAYFQELHSRLRARGVMLCYSDFAAGKAQMDVHRKMPPDYIKLSRTLTRSVLQEAARQTQLQTMLADFRKNGCEVIVPNVDSEREAHLFSRLGCRFGIAAPLGTSNDLASALQHEAAKRSVARRVLAATGSRD